MIIILKIHQVHHTPKRASAAEQLLQNGACRNAGHAGISPCFTLILDSSSKSASRLIRLVFWFFWKTQEVTRSLEDQNWRWRKLFWTTHPPTTIPTSFKAHQRLAPDAVGWFYNTKTEEPPRVLEGISCFGPFLNVLGNVWHTCVFPISQFMSWARILLATSCSAQRKQKHAKAGLRHWQLSKAKCCFQKLRRLAIYGDNSVLWGDALWCALQNYQISFARAAKPPAHLAVFARLIMVRARNRQNSHCCCNTATDCLRKKAGAKKKKVSSWARIM